MSPQCVPYHRSEAGRGSCCEEVSTNETQHQGDQSDNRVMPVSENQRRGVSNECSRGGQYLLSQQAEPRLCSRQL
jgi:hypothetical protein